MAFGVVALDVGPEGLAISFAVIGFVAVAVAARWHRPLVGHLGAAGHVTTAIALAVIPAFATDTGGDVAALVALSAFALGWALTTFAQETWGSSVADLLSRAMGEHPSLSRAVSVVPIVLSTLSVPLVLPMSLMATGALADDSPWLVVAGSSVVVAGGVLARLASGHRRMAGVIANLGLWMIVVGVLGTRGDRPTTAAQTVLVVGLVAAVGPTVRLTYMGWVAWLSSAAATLLVADIAGVPSESAHLVLIGWGAFVLIGALALDDVLAGRRAIGEGVRRPDLLPPVVLGSLALPLGLAPTYAQASWVFGWWSLAVAAVVLVVAAQLRVGALSAISWVLATVAYVALAPWAPAELPWTFLAEVIALLAFAELAARLWPTPVETGSLPRWLVGWDRTAFIAAHGVALLGLVAALDQGWIPATWAGTGAVAFGIAVRRRHAAWAVIGTGLVLVGAAVAGPGWLALALAATSAEATCGAVVSVGWVRRGLQVVGVVAAGGAWAAMCGWQDWGLAEAATASALAAGGVAMGLAVERDSPASVGTGWRGGPRSRWRVWCSRLLR